MNKRNGTNLDSLNSNNDAPEELPEDVAAFLKYKKETGRGLNDFMQTQRNFDEADSDTIIREYIRATEPGLDEADITAEMKQYQVDRELASEEKIEQVDLKRKKIEFKAKKFLKENSAKYTTKLESSSSDMPVELRDKIEAYDKLIEGNKGIDQKVSRKRDAFIEGTDKLFTKEFKGFEVELGGNKVLFNPSDVGTMKKSQSTLANFYDPFTDKDGILVDPEGYHKRLAVAMNLEAYTETCYKQGAADALVKESAEVKNIDMKTKHPHGSGNKTKGMKVRVVENPSSGGSSEYKGPL